jgi:hypothetical protein
VQYFFTHVKSCDEETRLYSEYELSRQQARQRRPESSGMSGGGQSGRLWPRSSLGQRLWQRFRTELTLLSLFSLSVSGVRLIAHANMYGIVLGA